MKILISPAKRLNFEDLNLEIDQSEISFSEKASKIVKTLKPYSQKDLSKLMNISDKLAELNWIRNQEYKTPFLPKESKQALFAFDGDVYSGIDAKNLNNGQINFLQNHLRILSGQYGLLKPLDKIMPYRLEMGAKLSIDGHKNLYDFWGNSITEKLNDENTPNDYIINLASNEYFKAINQKLLKGKIVTPIFKDYKNGILKTISIFAKKARGLMVRYIAEKEIINDIELLKNFDNEGYRFDCKLSDEKNFIFTR